MSILFLAMIIGVNMHSQTDKFIKLYEFLTKSDGTWKAFNPDFKVGDTVGFKDFIIKFKKKDLLSIDGVIYGISAKNDTINIWSFTEFYGPFKKKAIIIQRSSDGKSYAIGESTIVNENERVSDIDFFYSNGVSEKNKDIHLLFGEDKMRSTSFNYDKNGNQKLLSTLVWERKQNEIYNYKHVVVIPDSNRVLFVSDKDGDDEIYSMDIDGNNVKQLTNNESKDFLPAVSPNGKEIMFTSQRDRRDELYKMNIDGSNEIRVTNNDLLNNEADWSPNGDKIVFYSRPKEGAPPCMFIMNPDGSGRTKVTKNEGLVESFPNWSKTGKYISYTQGNNDGRNPDSYVYEVATGKAFAAADSEFYEFGTHWLDSDDKLLFSSNRSGHYHIYLVNISTKEIEQLTEWDANDSSPKTGFTPNEILFISDRSGPDRIYSMDLTTKEIKLIEANWDNP